MRFGRDWDQESIIHISKDKEGKFTFKLIFMDEVQETRVVDGIATDPIEMGITQREKEEKNINRIQDLLGLFSELGGKLVKLYVGRKYGVGFFGPKAGLKKPVPEKSSERDKPPGYW